MAARKEVRKWIQSMSGAEKDNLKKGFLEEHKEEYREYVERKYDELNSKS